MLSAPCLSNLDLQGWLHRKSGKTFFLPCYHSLATSLYFLWATLWKLNFCLKSPGKYSVHASAFCRTSPVCKAAYQYLSGSFFLQKSTRKAVSEKRIALMEWPLLGLDTCYLVSFLHIQLNPPGGFFAWWKVIKKLLDCKLCLRFKACRLLDILKLRAHRGEKYFLVQVQFSSCLLGMNPGLRITLLVRK